MLVFSVIILFFASWISTVASAPSKWIHPGAMLSRAQINFIKDKVSRREQPWARAADEMLRDRWLSASWNPTPHATVECGPYSKPDVGCKAERDDSLAAYGNALAWVISGNKAHAQKAIQIMDAYSATIKGHKNTNSPLQAGWVGSVWARAGEIIRYTDAGWSSASISRFANMLRTVYMPLTVNGTDKNVANWELSMTEAAILMAVFLEDGKSYDTAMRHFKARVPATIFMTSDGKYPKAARGQSSAPDKIIEWWFGQSDFRENGMGQETCRDLEHTGYSIASIAHVAETARIQGEDLYKTDIGTRLRWGIGFHSQFGNGKAAPSWLCKGALKLKFGPVTEVGYNALANRLGNSMPESKSYTESQRPAKNNGLFVAYETLTHANNPA
ncbi:hypothetical protein FQN57_001081 [Myotisia sp. PD_48]|nr:hypothetical protein FQN57_001081 [Myotisia sp. PD_48]